MQEWFKFNQKKRGKPLFIFLFLLFLIPFSFAYEECTRENSAEDIPCKVFSTWKPSSCTANVFIYDENGTNVANSTWVESVPFCYFFFNETNIQTYIYNSSIENGAITVQEGFKMIYLLYFFMAVSFVLLMIGFYKEDQTILSISGIAFMVCGMFISINGFSIYNNIVTHAIAIVFIALGAYVLLRTNLEGILESNI